MSAPALPRSLAGQHRVPLGAGVAAVGAVVIAIRLYSAPQDAWPGVLTAALYGVTLALGAGAFVAIQVVAGAEWWRRLAAAPLVLAGTLAVPLAALAVCLLFGLDTLYPWARPGALPEELLASRRAWLNPPAFLARAVVVSAAWLAVLGALRARGWSTRTPTFATDRRLVRAAVVFLVVLAPTLSVASWDWMMSLEPTFASTMYAVYAFAGAFQAGIACVIVMAHTRPALASGGLTSDERHDLGKLLFAFSAFWAYIWFCQYLLIWYANIPEETVHHARRLSAGWPVYFYLSAVLNFVVPFVALLGETPKRHASTLVRVAVLVLCGRWLDVYLLVAPAGGAAPSVPVAALAATAVVLGGMALLGRREAGLSSR